jgi:hypothetical protein
MLCLAVLAAVPLLLPAIPPLTDYPAHMGRYWLQIYGPTSLLSSYFDVQWRLTGNLGGDILIGIADVFFPFDTACKIVAVTAPVLMVFGLLWTSKEIHGNIPATSLFSLPLVYHYPLHWGFINYSLSISLAFISFALWMNIRRRRRFRSYLFALISAGVWLTHAYGWGVLGILIFAAELNGNRGDRVTWTAALTKTIVAVLPLTPPVFLMLLWRSGQSGAEIEGFFDLYAKAKHLLMIVRDRWLVLDVVYSISLLSIAAICFLKRFADRRLSAGVALLLIAYLLMPFKVFGSGYADLRLAPCVVALALLSIKSVRHDRSIATFAALYFVFRITATSWSFLIYDNDYRDQLSALDHVPSGSRILVQVEGPCDEWAKRRLEHLSSIALIRRQSFVNDQWVAEGAQNLRVHHELAGEFQADPSQIYYPQRCGLGPSLLAERLAIFPREAFDFVWLVGVREDVRQDDLVLVWTGERGGRLFRVSRSPAGS